MTDKKKGDGFQQVRFCLIGKLVKLWMAPTITSGGFQQVRFCLIGKHSVMDFIYLWLMYSFQQVRFCLIGKPKTHSCFWGLSQFPTSPILPNR